MELLMHFWFIKLCKDFEDILEILLMVFLKACFMLPHINIQFYTDQLQLNPMSRQGKKVQASPFINYVRPGLNLHQVEQIKHVFDLFDTTQSGLINPKDLKMALKEQGKKGTQTALYQLVCDLDQQGNGCIDFDNFIFFFTHTITGNEDPSQMQKIFALFDDEKTGFLSIASLRRICKSLSLHFDEVELQQMMKQADLDEDGFISFEQFSQIIHYGAKA